MAFSRFHRFRQGSAWGGIVVGLSLCTAVQAGRAADDPAITIQNAAVTIPVPANGREGTNQMGILRVTPPAHGRVIITTNLGPLSPDLARLFEFAGARLSNSVAQIGDSNRFPRNTIITNGLWRTRSAADWTSGFFPGCLWFLYEQSADGNFRTWAERWTGGITSQQYNPSTDDVGFMINSSFGNGYRLTTNADYRAVLLQGARSVSNRFNAAVGGFGCWSETTGAQYDTWMDTMMNLELLFRAAALSGDTNFRALAVSHAEKAMLNHVRTNGSTYHIVHYDGNTGAVLSRGTHAGYADESTWARGHAWATYGFAMAYRETGDERFLNTARRLADYYLANAPADGVPYWDYQAPNIPNEPRDSSAAAITLSALLELGQQVSSAADTARYWQAATHIFGSLSSSNYLAAGAGSSGILLHGVGETPPLWDQEIDVSLIYGDYYFIEALKRYREIYSRATVTYVPEPDFCGTDSFFCQVGESGGGCVTATVTVVVEPGTNTFPARLAFDPAAGLPVISFPAAAGRLYEVQYRDGLAPADGWQSLGPARPGPGSTLSITDSNLAPRRFYRVSARPMTP